MADNEIVILALTEKGRRAKELGGHHRYQLDEKHKRDLEDRLNKSIIENEYKEALSCISFSLPSHL